MIYSRFGTRLTPINKQQDASGRISLEVHAEGAIEPRIYALSDLRADDGMAEINDALSKLPWRNIAPAIPPLTEPPCNEPFPA